MSSPPPTPDHLQASGPGAAPGCPLCRAADPAAAAAAWSDGRRCVDDPHLGVTLLRCQQCGDPALRIFTELIDWAGGDDSQASIIVPFPATAAGFLAEIGDASGTAAALDDLPSLHYLMRCQPRGVAEPDRWAWMHGRPVMLPFS
jgi:hypothetical protein